MKRTIYKCDFCGEEVETSDMPYVTVYCSHRHPEAQFDICRKCLPDISFRDAMLKYFRKIKGE